MHLYYLVQQLANSPQARSSHTWDCLEMDDEKISTDSTADCSICIADNSQSCFIIITIAKSVNQHFCY